MKTNYTTLQITKEMNAHIRKFCRTHGVNASFITEKFWSSLISSSIQIGSVVDLTPEVKDVILNEISGSTFLQGK